MASKKKENKNRISKEEKGRKKYKSSVLLLVFAYRETLVLDEKY